MSHAFALVLALLLDAAMGEPDALWKRIPHPAVLMGRAVAALDARLNSGPGRRGRGILALAVLVLASLALGQLIASVFGTLGEIALAAVLLAQRSLADHVGDVATALRRSLPEGRSAVARIVGRDTAAMDEAAVSRAAIESGAENLSDGVIAPAFWFLLLGLPGILAYKAVNTADSMIGYRTPRHAEFGWAAARFDDLLNLIPARLTAALLALQAPRRGLWSEIAAEAARHRSPNAGWPEAALARLIGVALSGPRAYDGEIRDYPFVNPDGRRRIGPRDIEAARRKLWVTWGIATAIVAFLAIL